jgi:hypothetical protein
MGYETLLHDLKNRLTLVPHNGPKRRHATLLPARPRTLQPTRVL